MSFLWRLRICSWFGRLDEARVVLVIRKIILSYWSLNARNVANAFCTVDLVSLVAWWFNDARQFVSRHRIFSWRHDCLSVAHLVCQYICGGGLVAYSTNRTCFFTGSLFLAFLAIVQVTPWFLFGRDWGLLCAFDGLLNSGRVLWTALLGVSGWATDLIVVAQNLSHALFKLWLSQAVTRHCNKFFRPQFLNLTNLPWSHNNWTSNCKWIKLQELILF